MGDQTWWGEAPERPHNSNEALDSARPRVCFTEWRAEPCLNVCHAADRYELVDSAELADFESIKGHGRRREAARRASR
jgi:hypothetical protein